MSAILTAEHLSKSFGDRPAVVDASLQLKSGELVTVLGASGSGKTTLFRCLTRLTEPDAGRIEIAEKPLLDLKGHSLARARREIGVVFQQFNLVRRITAFDNVIAGRLADAPLWRVMSRRYSEADERIAHGALSAVGLRDQTWQRADTLSGGQQQRVAIARAIVQDCRVLLADEPVASLDPETAVSVLELLRDLTRARGIAVLCTLHQPQLAERFADRVLRMEAGRLST